MKDGRDGSQAGRRERGLEYLALTCMLLALGGEKTCVSMRVRSKAPPEQEQIVSGRQRNNNSTATNQ